MLYVLFNEFPCMYVSNYYLEVFHSVKTSGCNYISSHFDISILYLSTVWCVMVVTKSVTCMTHLNISAKWSQIFTKTSANINIGLESRLKLFTGACVHARTHSVRKRARYFCAFFPTFLCQFFEILKPFLTENEKNEATLKENIDKTQLFYFINFFPTSLEACMTHVNVRAPVISFKQCIIWGWARKWKLVRKSHVNSQ